MPEGRLIALTVGPILVTETLSSPAGPSNSLKLIVSQISS